MNCVICNKEIEESSYSHKVICNDKCFYIDFWNDKVKIKDDNYTVRIDGKHYNIGNENSKNPFRGFGGHKSIIRFFDGREVITTNIWHNGTIPDNYKEILPDNALLLGINIEANEEIGIIGGLIGLGAFCLVYIGEYTKLLK